MKPETARNLNYLNLDFYRKTFGIWNPNLNYYWEGWLVLKPILEKYFLNLSNDIQILDLGSGNGRFYNYLKENFQKKFEYTGIDFEQELIKACNLRFKNQRNINFICLDLLDNNNLCLLSQKFDQKIDLVVAFGLFHHIPGEENRKHLFEHIIEILKPGACFIFTIWQFWKEERLLKRVLDLNSLEATEVCRKFKIEIPDLESNDFILNWVKLVKSHRYVAKLNFEEIKEFLSQNGLKLDQTFCADGRNSNRNFYAIYKKS